MIRAVIRVVSLTLTLIVPCLALSTFRGIQPGVSTRADVQRVLGAPSASNGPQSAEFRLKDQSGTAIVSYSPEGIAEEIEFRFAAPLERSDVISALSLPSDPTASDVNPQMQAWEEFFGGPRTLVLVHSGPNSNSAIVAVRYLSRSGYDRELTRVQGGSAPQAPAQPTPLAVSNPTPLYDPAACRELYEWARAETDVANKSKNPARRQAIIEVRLNAQKGDCVVARRLADRYRADYR